MNTPIDPAENPTVDHHVRAFLKALNSSGGQPLETLAPPPMPARYSSTPRLPPTSRCRLAMSNIAPSRGMASRSASSSSGQRPHREEARLHVLPRRRMDPRRLPDARALRPRPCRGFRIPRSVCGVLPLARSPLPDRDQPSLRRQRNGWPLTATKSAWTERSSLSSATASAAT